MKKRASLCWSLAIGLPFLFGLLFLTLSGYRFSAMVCMTLSGIAAIYCVLTHIKRPFALWLRRILSGVLLVLILLGAVTGIFIIRAASGTDASCDCIIVLGAAVHGDVPSMSLRERLDAAVSYLQAHPDTVCVVSGGQGDGENMTEAACMYRYLIGKGIAADRILSEDKAASTWENIRFSMELLEQTYGTLPESVGLLSSEYHLFRAGLIAKKQGLDTVGIPATTQIFTLRVNYFLREIGGVWYTILRSESNA